ncbi:hypothetical protein PR202_gb23826 [Eleusine coracana subsp. coracana]|uniref:Uncharacterized protein n=1 Tax=Eleusine coracana subsp. coracana TaxID=191504 RepID=A0AAV5FK30_ELECO|nr:hypothetical protein PR202_gb23826 [Eleusine coracana subsp. coracana]
MRFRRVKSTNKSRKSSAPLQNGEKKIDGGANTNSRQVAPETHLGTVDYGKQSYSFETSVGSSIDDTFFEAYPWLDSDCDDEFYSVNGDLTPARSITSQSSKTIPPGSPKLLTLGAILKAEPLKLPSPQKKLADLLRESQDDDSEVGGPDDLSRGDSFRAGQEAGRCCMPQLARAVSCNGRGKRNK